jgi:trans-aconitate methyltransferase
VIEFIALAAVLATVALVVVYSIVTGVPPMPTTAKVSDAIFDLIPAGFDGSVVELGAGWGSLAISLARRLPAAHVIAVERSPVPWLVARAAHAVLRLPNLAIRRGNFFRMQLNDVDLVVCYLMGEAMRHLGPKLRAELRPGSLIISNTFALPGWEPERTIEVTDMYQTRVYLYRAAGPAA